MRPDRTTMWINGLVRCVLMAGFCAALSTAAFAAEKYTLQLDWLPSGDKAPAYVAVKEGFFAAEGLDITIQNARGSADALTKVATGAADFGTGGLPSLMSAAAQSPLPVKAILAVYTKQPDSLFVPKGGPIKTLKDVVGRKVGTATFTSSNTLWPLFLNVNSIDPASVSLTKVDPAVLAPMLASGQIDATISWLTVAPTYRSVLRQTGKEMDVLPWSQFGLDGYGFAIFASERVIKADPKSVAAFVRAMSKAIAFSVENPEKSGAIVHEAASTVDPEIAAQSMAAAIPLIKNDVSAKDGMGRFEPSLLKKTWEWVAKSENYPIDRINPETLVNQSFQPKS
jgi:NitT/TauT family transport system substrate-binding protein